MATAEISAITEQLAGTKVDVQNELSFAGRGLRLNTEDDAKEFVDGIEKCEHMTALRLEGNTMGIDAAKAISKALEKHPELEKAFWSDMFTGRLKTEIPQALRHLGEGIITANAHLVELELSDNAFGPNGLEGLVDFLQSESCFTLKVLRLNNNGLGIFGGQMLSKSLIACHQNSSQSGKPLSLEVFICGRNRLENEGAMAIADSFKVIGTLREVVMMQNSITHPGITAIAHALEANVQLRLLNLNDNIFTAKGAISMAKSLPKLQNLEVINFGDCLVRTQGALALATSLQHGHDKLRELLLNGNEIRIDGAQAIVEAIQSKTNLEMLDLDANQLGEYGIENVRLQMRESGIEDCLGSFSDDEGDEDDDEEEDADKTEDAEEEEDGEVVDDPHLHVTGHAITPQKQIVNVRDFMQFPSPTKLMELGKDRVSAIKQELGDKANDVDEAVKVVIRIASVVTYADEKSKAAASECADALLSRLFSNADQCELITNSILVHLGLIKGEDKKYRPPNDITGPLLIIEHVIRQSYFPKSSKNTLHTFIDKPSALLEAATEARHKLLTTLYQV